MNNLNLQENLNPETQSSSIINADEDNDLIEKGLLGFQALFQTLETSNEEISDSNKSELQFLGALLIIFKVLLIENPANESAVQFSAFFKFCEIYQETILSLKDQEKINEKFLTDLSFRQESSKALGLLLKDFLENELGTLLNIYKKFSQAFDSQELAINNLTEFSEEESDSKKEKDSSKENENK